MKRDARAELAQLRAAEAELQEAQKVIKSKNELINMLVDYTFGFRDKFAEQAAERDALQERITALEQAIDKALEQIENGDLKVAHKLLSEVYAAHPATPAPEQGGEQSETH